MSVVTMTMAMLFQTMTMSVTVAVSVCLCVCLHVLQFLAVGSQRVLAIVQCMAVTVLDAVGQDGGQYVCGDGVEEGSTGEDETQTDNTTVHVCG